MWLLLPFEIDDPRIARRVRASQERVAHLIKPRTLKELDADVRKWLTLAYRAAG